MDDFDAYAPTPSVLSIRLLAPAVKRKVKPSPRDIRQDFVLALLQDVYMKIISGYGGLTGRLARLDK